MKYEDECSVSKASDRHHLPYNECEKKERPDIIFK
jgi:hypothetical protein